MTLQEHEQLLKNQLAAIYDSREANNIADWVMENLTGWKKIDRLVHNKTELPRLQVIKLIGYTQDLLEHKPVQYVLKEAWFSGLKLYVDESVLIPRPETEELVEWIAAEGKDRIILDVGTGSGCIPIALKSKLPSSIIHACDVSEQALQVAMKNASTHNADINFLLLDFLDKNALSKLPQVDILVSNPPYVPLKDKEGMNHNVVRYEPHLALFVQDNDPLIFYDALADFAATNLLPGGCIFAEIHEELGKSVQDLFNAKGFTKTLVKKDMQEKDRMIRAAKQ